MMETLEETLEFNEFRSKFCIAIGIDALNGNYQWTSWRNHAINETNIWTGNQIAIYLS